MIRSERMFSGRKLEHFGGLLGLEVRQHDGDDLRMFVAHQLGDGLRSPSTSALEALALAAEPDAVHQRRGLVVAERIDQHLAHEVVAADADAKSGFPRCSVKSLSTPRTSSRDTLVSSAMAAPEPLHVLRAHVLEDFGRFALAERQQQDGRALDTVAGRAVGASAIARHPAFTTCATRFGSCATSPRACGDLLFVGESRRLGRGRRARRPRRPPSLPRARPGATRLRTRRASASPW